MKTEYAGKYTIEQLSRSSFSPRDAFDIQALFQELSPERTPPEAHKIGLSLPCVSVWIARLWETGQIVAMATLATIPSLTMKRSGEIRDVVTMEKHRGNGLMETILQEIISHARSENFLYLQLTSRPKRIVANILYGKLGLIQTASAVEDEAFGTNYYRLYL